MLDFRMTDTMSGFKVNDTNSFPSFAELALYLS